MKSLMVILMVLGTVGALLLVQVLVSLMTRRMIAQRNRPENVVQVH